MHKRYGRQRGSSDGSENRISVTVTTVSRSLIAVSSFAISGDGCMDHRTGPQYRFSIRNSQPSHTFIPHDSVKRLIGHDEEGVWK